MIYGNLINQCALFVIPTKAAPVKEGIKKTGLWIKPGRTDHRMSFMTFLTESTVQRRQATPHIFSGVTYDQYPLLLSTRPLRDWPLIQRS